MPLLVRITATMVALIALLLAIAYTASARLMPGPTAYHAHSYLDTHK
jgi:hypothetical protein